MIAVMTGGAVVVAPAVTAAGSPVTATMSMPMIDACALLFDWEDLGGNGGSGVAMEDKDD